MLFVSPNAIIENNHISIAMVEGTTTQAQVQKR